MGQTIDWWNNLGIKGMLYSLLLLNIFIVLFFSNNNAYTYSSFSIVIGVIFGSLILFDTVKYAAKPNKDIKTSYLIKRLFGAFTITAFCIWSFFLLVEMSMDIFNYKNKNIEAIFTSHHKTNLRAGATKICVWYGVAVDESGDSHRFCVGHIPNHKKLEAFENEKVYLIGRESWAGFVVDNVILFNEAPQTNTSKL